MLLIKKIFKWDFWGGVIYHIGMWVLLISLLFLNGYMWMRYFEGGEEVFILGNIYISVVSLTGIYFLIKSKRVKTR